MPTGRKLYQAVSLDKFTHTHTKQFMILRDFKRIKLLTLWNHNYTLTREEAEWESDKKADDEED